MAATKRDSDQSLRFEKSAKQPSTRTGLVPAVSDVVAVLESVRRVARSYGISGSVLKPCVAFLLDGNLGATGRHEAAFAIAADLRGSELERSEIEGVLTRWAMRLGYRVRDCQRAVNSAFAKNADGTFRYHAPGLAKRRGTKYHAVLAPVCDAVGCPANCPPFRDLYVGPREEDADRFDDLGWPKWPLRHRWRAASGVYIALCPLERFRSLRCGALLRTSYRQLSTFAAANPRTVGRELYRLDERDADDLPTALLARLLAPALVISQDKDLLTPGIARAQWQPIPPDARDVDAQHSLLSGCVQGALVSGRALAEGKKLAPRAAPEDPPHATVAVAALVSATFFYLRSDDGRRRRTSTAGWGRRIGAFVTELAVQGHRAAQRPAAAASGARDEPTDLERVARAVAVASMPLTPTAIPDVADVPVACVRAFLGAPMFTHDISGRYSLGRPEPSEPLAGVTTCGSQPGNRSAVVPPRRR